MSTGADPAQQQAGQDPYEVLFDLIRGGAGQDARAALVCLATLEHDHAFARAFRAFSGRPDTRNLAEDLAQEHVVRILQHLPSLLEHPIPRKYLGRIVRSLINDQLKRFQRDRIVAGVGSGGGEGDDPGAPRQIDPVDLGPDASWELAHEEETHCVRDAVDSLSPPYRQILSLYYFEGLSSKEIAEYLDITVTAVNMRLYHARNALRLALAAGDGE